MLDRYSIEAYNIANSKHFIDATVEALYKGKEEGHKALAKLVMREMPNGYVVITNKKDYNKVNWIAVAIELEKSLKDRSMWNPPIPQPKLSAGAVIVNRIVGTSQ